MRFIDADKLIKQMLKNCPFVLDTTHYDNIYGIPIVEAIPIEWIETYLDEHWSDECYWDGVGRTLEKVIKQWEKECGK